MEISIIIPVYNEEGNLPELYKRLINVLESGKIIKVHKFPKDTYLELFRVSISTNRTECIVTNNITQDYTDDIRKEIAIRWNIEQFHGKEKQLTGISYCQCRLNRSQRNHICASILVWIFLKKTAYKLNKTIY